MSEQPDLCREHHFMLKAELDSLKKEFDDLTKNCHDMHCFFFGGTNQLDGHISFVDKLNTLYDNQQHILNFLITFLSIFGVMLISGLIGLGVQLHRLDTTSQNLTVFMENQRQIELDIAQLKAKVGMNEKNNNTLDGGRL